MKPYPHRYEVDASAQASGNVELSAAGLPPISSAPPIEFDGPGDQWSPESLLVAAVGDCFVLTFRAIANASRFEWVHLDCRAEGTLDRVDGVTRFVGMRLHARLTLPSGGKQEMGRRLLEKAEKTCLVTNSLSTRTELQPEVVTG
jgi:organic hydroperoxide reductase OsmC/OhrA